MKSFREGKTSLKPIELGLLGDVKGKTLLHLQCHFGQDTISWARLGAKATGIDLSDESIRVATDLAKETGADARFIVSNVYDIESHLDEPFDIVFTSYGTICWLPDLNEWARLIAKYLKAGGTFLIADFHPQVLMLNWDTMLPEFPYFTTARPIEEDAQGSYAMDSEGQETLKEYSWNHAVSEVWNALKGAGLTVTVFNEYDYAPYNCFPGMVARAPGEYVFEKAPQMPCAYAIKAIKQKEAEIK
jgi:SAM-dependent methyltransferase